LSRHRAWRIGGDDAGIGFVVEKSRLGVNVGAVAFPAITIFT
jgi:hypothetical protein